MKKYHFFPAALALLMTFLLVVPVAAAPAPALTCGAAILVDGDHDEVLFDHNAHQRMYPASITKIMTSLLVMEAINRGELRLDQEITATQSAIDAKTPDSSTQNIQPGEVLTLEELLYCDIVASACEACTILAETVAGSIPEFVDMMNRRAAELGMADTNFVNPHGLHEPQHYTTAYDIYLMAKEAMKYETFRTIVATDRHEVPATNMSGPRTLYSTNALISNWQIQGYTYSKAIGIKTGSTPDAGYCLASAAIDPYGRTFYCVVLNTQNVREEDGSITRYSFKESKELLEWGFNNFQRVTLLDQNTQMWEVPVTLSDDQDHVVVQPRGELECTMTSDYDPSKAELITDLPESIEAPVQAGDKLGTVTFVYKGESYGTLDLVAVSGAERSEFQYRLKIVREHLELWWVKALLILAAVLVFFLIFLCAVVLPRRRRNNRGYHYSGNRRRRY